MCYSLCELDFVMRWRQFVEWLLSTFKRFILMKWKYLIVWQRHSVSRSLCIISICRLLVASLQAINVQCSSFLNYFYFSRAFGTIQNGRGCLLVLSSVGWRWQSMYLLIYFFFFLFYLFLLSYKENHLPYRIKWFSSAKLSHRPGFLFLRWIFIILSPIWLNGIKAINKCRLNCFYNDEKVIIEHSTFIMWTFY